MKLIEELVIAFALSTPIHRNYTGVFKPPISAMTSDDPIPILTVSVLSGYIEKMINLVHCKFPNQGDCKHLDLWKPSDVPSWW